MHEAKNTQRALVRIAYDGKVHKQFRGPNAKERFDNEIRVLRYLESRDCPFVPRIISEDENQLIVVLSNCGSRVEKISEEKVRSLFAELETYGVQHDDPFDRNVTYRSTDGRFCIIDFEFATIIDEKSATAGVTKASNDSVSQTPTRLHWSARSHRGRFRPNNEDTYLTAKIHKSGLRFLGTEGYDSMDSNEWLFAVSDGMGGEKSGEFASRITVQRATSILPPHHGGPLTINRTLSQAVLVNMFHQIHSDLMNLAKYDINLRDMGATLTLVWLRGTAAIWAHVGDSRLYLERKGNPIQQLTEDHSHVGWLLRNKKIREIEFRTHPGRSVLSQCLGSNHQFLNPQTGFVNLETGDKLLLCTDGVVDGHFDRGLAEMLTDPPAKWKSQSAADRIVNSAVESNGRDNASAVVIELG
jgi:serine/threonine protein phosphatase PrpC